MSEIVVFGKIESYSDVLELSDRNLEFVNVESSPQEENFKKLASYNDYFYYNF